MARPAFGGPPLAQQRPRGGAWRLRHWGLRKKLLAVLLVPLLLGGALGGLRVADRVADTAELGALERQLGLGQQVAAAVHELQRERNLMAGFVASGRGGDRSALDGQIRRVDGEFGAVASARTPGFSPDVARSYRAARDRMSGIAAVRNTAATTAYPVDAVIGAYSAIIDSLLDLNRAVLGAAEGPLLRQVDGVTALATAKEQIAVEHATVLAAILGRELTPSQEASLRAADARFDAAATEFARSADRQQQELYSGTVTGPAVDNRERLEAALVPSGSGEPLNLSAPDWEASAGATADLVRQVEAALVGQLRTDAASLAATAQREAVRDAVIVSVLLVAAMALLVIVARSLLRPLRALRTTAFDVADRRLPEAIEAMRAARGQVPDFAVDPVPVHTREEIGQLARAFDAVHNEAVRLAAEQALLRNNVNDIFVNLSRRSQSLVERQLQLIEQLESGESDPEQLGNLFQLDHLATRMRRNGENLLVLAGGELRQRSGQPVAVLDVLRAAVSEIEEYRRVMVRRPIGVSVTGPVVNDLVHLVAELLDNATSFSPPDTQVVVTSGLTDGGGLVLEIIDSGIGMSVAELNDTNDRLAAPPVVDVTVSRRMGLFVVSRLAARHDITVRLRGRRDEPGLTATVDVPAAHLTSETVQFDSRAAGLAAPHTFDRAGTGLQLPMQVTVVDADRDSDRGGPASVDVLERAGQRDPHRIEDEWVDLFGKPDSGLPAEPRSGGGEPEVGVPGGGWEAGPPDPAPDVEAPPVEAHPEPPPVEAPPVEDSPIFTE
ncbi:MAG: nitrate- and nitrite sensing domain-containing protein, partial [Pseudonocardiaceae bacterium]